jgi:hypothetical protein
MVHRMKRRQSSTNVCPALKVRVRQTLARVYEHQLRVTSSPIARPGLAHRVVNERIRVAVGRSKATLI